MPSASGTTPGRLPPPSGARRRDGTPAGPHALIADEPIGRLGTPDEIVAAVLWRCSDAVFLRHRRALVADGGRIV